MPENSNLTVINPDDFDLYAVDITLDGQHVDGAYCWATSIETDAGTYLHLAAGPSEAMNDLDSAVEALAGYCDEHQINGMSYDQYWAEMPEDWDVSSNGSSYLGYDIEEEWRDWVTLFQTVRYSHCKVARRFEVVK